MQINKISQKCKTLLPIIVLSFLMIPSIALAEAESDWINKVEKNITPMKPVFGVEEKPKDIRVLVADIIQVFLGLLATICIVLIVTAGIKWMSSQGNSVKIDSARNTIVAAAVGLGIILAAFALTIYIGRSVVGVTTDDVSNQPQNSEY